MSDKPKKRMPYSTRAQRRQWLYEHQRELKNASKREIIKAMKKAGLVAPTTYAMDVKL